MFLHHQSVVAGSKQVAQQEVLIQLIYNHSPYSTICQPVIT